jgi:hypothetical protein
VDGVVEAAVQLAQDARVQVDQVVAAQVELFDVRVRRIVRARAERAAVDFGLAEEENKYGSNVLFRPKS